MIERFTRGNKDIELSNQICKDCDIDYYTSQYVMIQLMYHVDTYKFEYKNINYWRIQGYVFIKDLLNKDIITFPGNISTIDGEYILFFTDQLIIGPVAQMEEPQISNL